MKNIEFKFDTGNTAFMLFGADIVEGKISSVSYGKESYSRVGSIAYSFNPGVNNYQQQKNVMENRLFLTKEECMNHIMRQNNMSINTELKDKS